MHYTPYGGSEIFLSRFIERLVDEGHECHIFATQWDKSKKNNILIHNVWFLKWPSFMKVLSFAVGSYFALKRVPLDVILSFERTLYHDVFRAGDGCHKEWLIQRRKAVSPLRYLTILFNPFHLALLFIEKKIFKMKKLQAIIANSHMVKREIIKHYDVRENNIHIIYNGLDPTLFNLMGASELRKKYRESLGISDNTFLLLFVGSGFERKGLLYLIEAVAILKKRINTIKLLVVGRGKTRRYESISYKCNIGQDVIFLGPQRDVRGLYSASDIFVLPTLYDPFSNATLEAMAYGKPVVTSKFNGASEVVEKEDMGCIIQEPKNPDEIASKTEEVIVKVNKKVYKDKDKNIAKNYSIESTVKEYLHILEKIKISRNERL